MTMNQLQSQREEPPTLSPKHVLELEEDDSAIILSSTGPDIFIGGDADPANCRRVAIALWAIHNPIVEQMFDKATAEG